MPSRKRFADSQYVGQSKDFEYILREIESEKGIFSDSNEVSSLEDIVYPSRKTRLRNKYLNRIFPPTS